MDIFILTAAFVCFAISFCTTLRWYTSSRISSELRAQRTRYESDLRLADQRLSETQQELQHSRRSFEQLLEAAEEKHGKALEQLQQAIADCDDLKEQVRKRDEQLVDERRKRKALEFDHRRALRWNQIIFQVKDVAEAECRIEKLNKMKQEKENLQQQLDHMRWDLLEVQEKLQDSVDRQQNFRDLYQRARDENCYLTDQLHRTSQQEESLKNQQAELLQTISDSSCQVEELSKNLKSSQEEVRDMKVRIEKQSEEVDRLEKELVAEGKREETLRNMLTNGTNYEEYLKKKLRMSRATCKDMRDKWMKEAAQNYSHHDCYTAIRRDMQNLKLDNREKGEKIRQLERRLRSLEEKKCVECPRLSYQLRHCRRKMFAAQRQAAQQKCYTSLVHSFLHVFLLPYYVLLFAASTMRECYFVVTR
ncbi:golgin subfamily A member 6-like protein 26 [Ptychodera flava]|uniref:golgin subfamily A member 6-like protein 26 n=1 Tax=Ptychodera flava TaxID=63121 RepID=UPI00396A5A07